jgi:serine/threonine protein kinase
MYSLLRVCRQATQGDCTIGTLKAFIVSLVKPVAYLSFSVNHVGERLDAENVCWITQRILNALQYLHYHGVVHGDIKPQNLIVQEETHSVCLVDFGLAMVKPTSKDKAKGYTPIFAAPEQIAGQTLLPESDFYSLGMTMLYMLTGSLEHTERLLIPDDVPNPLCDFIKRLLRRDVLMRPRWDKEDLNETLQAVRMASFGRAQSNMKRLMDPKKHSVNTK